MRIITGKSEKGLEYYILPVNTAETVCVQLIGKLGSNQDQHKIGIGHLLEHTIVENIKTKVALNNLLSKGAKFIASTSRDDVIFGIHVLKSELKGALTLFETILEETLDSNLLLSNIKNTVRSEIYRNDNNPRKKVRQNFYSNLFPNTRLAIKNTGEDQDISHITLFDLIEYKKEHFHSNNFKLVIVGKVDAKTFQNDIAQMGVLKSQITKITNYRFQSNLDTEINKIKYNGKKLNCFIGGCDNIRIDNNLKYPTILLANILNIHFNKVVKNAGLSYKNSVDAFCGPSFGTFTFYAEVASENTKVLPSIVTKIIKSIVLKEAEIEYAKNRLIADIIFLNEKIALKTNYYAENITHNTGFVSHTAEINKINKLKKREIEEALDLIRTNHMVFVTD